MNLVLWFRKHLTPMAKAAQKGWIKPGHKYVRRWWDAQANRWRYEYYEAERPDHHHDADAVVIGLPGNRLGVATEYDPKVKDKLKALGGKWDPERKVWAFDAKLYLEKVRPYLRRAVYDLEAAEILKPHLEPDALPDVEPEEGRETATHYADGWPKSHHMTNARMRFGLYDDREPAPADLEPAIRILASVEAVRKGKLEERWAPRGFFLQGGTLRDRLEAFKKAGDKFLRGNGQRGFFLGNILSPGDIFADGVLILVRSPEDAAQARRILGDKKVMTNSEELRGYEVLTPQDLEAAWGDPERRIHILKHMGMVYVDGRPGEWEDVPALKEALSRVGVAFFGTSEAPTPEDLHNGVANLLRMPGFLGRKGGDEVVRAYQDPKLAGRFPKDLVRAGALIAVPQGEPEEASPPTPNAPRGDTKPPAPVQPGLWEDIPPKTVAGKRGKPTPPPKGVYQPSLFELAKALGYRPGSRLVLKAEVRNIPVERLKWVDRPKERAKVPKDRYLLPDERKFPYRNKDGSINCRLLKAAISRAAQHGYKEEEERARKLYAKHCKGE